MTTKTKEKPILFSAPMVRAILDGRKTQTRRIMNPQPPSVEAVSNHAGIGYHWMNCADQGMPDEWRPVGPVWAVMKEIGDNPKLARLKCRYGTAGDRLWVRETWRRIVSGLNCGKVDYYADDPGASGAGFMPWKPSIHMLRKDSRITLEITSVRVERLQSIRHDDAVAEGAMTLDSQFMQDVARNAAYEGRRSVDAVDYFAGLWRKINGPDSWDANPWVWVVSFRRITP